MQTATIASKPRPVTKVRASTWKEPSAKVPEKPRVGDDPFYSEKNMRRLLRSIANANAGKLTEHELIEV